MTCNYNQIDKYLESNNIKVITSQKEQFNLWKKNELISRVRKNVYLPSDILDKFKIGCASVDGGILCYHSALEYYLLQTQEFNILYVYADKPFRTFNYQGIQYVYKSLLFTHKPLTIKSKDGFGIKVTSLSQTIIDCLYNIGLAGGIEELMYALEDLNGEMIKEKDLLICLKKYNNKSLYQRAGLMFYKYKERWGLSDSFFDICKSNSKGSVSYLINPHYCDKYDKNWNICIPGNLSSMIKY